MTAFIVAMTVLQFMQAGMNLTRETDKPVASVIGALVNLGLGIWGITLLIN